MKLTLDKSWELCLKQWRWIAKQVRAESEKSINDLKTIWCTENGFDVCANCFFCGYDNQHLTKKEEMCDKCPARKIDKEFDCCNDKYLFHRNPLAFYAKLLELNRKRKKEV